MEISEEKRREYAQRLILARMRMLNTNGFYGLLLMHAAFALDDTLETAATDGNKIYFSPTFLETLSDRELDFVLMHEIMHIALEHCARDGDRDPYLFNIACDIVVNSNILRSNDMRISSITLNAFGECMHKAPNGKEGYEYTAEQVYDMFEKRCGKKSAGGGAGGKNKGKDGAGGSVAGGEFGATIDSHELWNDPSSYDRAEWEMRVANAVEAISARGGKNCGGIPLGIERLMKELKDPQIDWRTVLDDFVQEDVCDYSFTPPDRRMDNDFILPDYNERDTEVRDVLFMIDTSASMSDEAVTAAYSEIHGAIEQFGGKLAGWLGFFDAAVVEPKAFSGVDEFRVIKPKGYGGTNFNAVFKYITDHPLENLASIIIMTDGYAPFPNEAVANGVPVLWLIVGSDVAPPWGRVARIGLDKK